MPEFENLDDYAWMMPVIQDIEASQAHALGEWAIKEFKPNSVIDIGCGPGNYLLPYVSAGIECLGIDAEATAGADIPDNFERVDLRYPWDAGKVYDLGICIEVAEHLPATFAAQLVETITKCCNMVIFTAAFPGQGGHFHHNEQQKEYWIDLFKQYGFDIHPLQEKLTDEIQTNQAYEQVMFLRWNTMLLGKTNDDRP
jgi:SAM-dependent methyltransferase